MADRKSTLIDPIFWTPDDVIDLVAVDAENNPNGVDTYETGTEFDSDIQDYDEWNEDVLEETPIDDLPYGLPVVDEFTVIDTNVRTQPDGTHLVDITIEVEDFINVNGYNVRLTRV